jgi:predicted site-specific integrase-resolvase
MTKYLSAKEIMKLLGVSAQKLAYWRKTNKIIYQKVAYKVYLYELPEFEKKINTRKHILYARVSNTKQNDDLKRQIQLLRTYTAAKGIIPDEVIEDIGSGMNEERVGFDKLLKLIVNNEVDSIYITYKDRLTRFGFGYLEQFFNKFDTKIVVINATSEEEFQTELTQDLISIIHHFSMKLYSNRRKSLKAITKDLLNTIEI